MGKKEIRQRQTDVSNVNGAAVGKELEQTLTVDDSFLPAPEELTKYKEIDTNIVELLCRMSEREQQARHKLDEQKLRIIRKSESRQFALNIWGMIFALLALVVMMGVAALALYLDRPWIATLFGVLSAASIVSLFIRPNKAD